MERTREVTSSLLLSGGSDAPETARSQERSVLPAVTDFQLRSSPASAEEDRKHSEQIKPLAKYCVMVHVSQASPEKVD